MPIYRERGWFIPLADDVPIEAGADLRNQILFRNEATETGLEEIFVRQGGKPYAITVGEELVGEGRVFAILSSQGDPDLLYVITGQREPMMENPTEVARHDLLDEIVYTQLKIQDSLTARN